MIEKDIVTSVEKEYKKIEEEREPKSGRFNKEEFEEQLYIELGKQIGRRYVKRGVLVVPQSDNIKKMSEEEKLKFNFSSFLFKIIFLLFLLTYLKHLLVLID